MNKLGIRKAGILAMSSLALLLTACGDNKDVVTEAPKAEAANLGNVMPVASTQARGTCTGTYPSYWQDPQFSQQWVGQEVSNVPTPDWDGPVWQISDDFPTSPVDDSANQPWRDARFDALFAEGTPAAEKEKLAFEYGWLVMNYMQEGNVGIEGQEDWDVCNNTIRPWYNMPYQTYDPMSGREFTHGLTREAPVTFSTPEGDVASTMWAVGYFNATAAYTLGTVWKKDGTAKIPETNLSFDEGAVIGKPLFNTASAMQLPVLDNMPNWNANISNPTFCKCTPSKGSECTLIEESVQCPRSTTKWDNVSLLQFDFAVKDSRAKGTEWVFGTFVADGKRKANVEEPWQRISLLGVMWGNDTPPEGQLAYNYPMDTRIHGFQEEVIFWDAVDELNKYGGPDVMKRMGHLGCNYRLNGPADNANSSCMSCHGTASVPDQNIITPPLLSQFSAITKECVTPTPGNPLTGTDRSGSPATVNDGVDFAAVDSVYFANTPAAEPFNMTVETATGPVNLMGDGVPSYANGTKEWISLDYSLQLSISLTQWMQWQDHSDDPVEGRIHMKEIRRGYLTK